MRVGITGGIGAGKSTIAHVLIAMGYPVYNSDEQAKWLMNNNQDLIEQITHKFGSDSYINQSLNRAFIAQQLFNSVENQTWIREVVHPFVRLDFDNWSTKQTSTLVFQESALIFESAIYKRLDAVIAVLAPVELRIQRTIQRDGLSIDEIKKRMNAQVSDALRKERANYVIVNDDQQLVVPQVLTVLKSLL